MGKASRFGGVSSAKVNERGEYLGEGDYEVEIKRCKMFSSRKKEDFFIVECKVLESTNEKHPAGCERNWMVKMNQDTTDSNLKGFILAAIGIDKGDAEKVKEVADALPGALAAALDDPTDPECKNELAGTRLHVNVKIVKTKENTDFSAHNWTPSTKKAA